MLKGRFLGLILLVGVWLPLSGCMVTYQDLNGVRESLQTQITDLDNQVQDLKKGVSSSEKKAASERDSLRKDVQEVRGRMSAAEEEIRKIREDLAKTRQDLGEVRRLQADLNADLDAVRSQGLQRAGEVEQSTLRSLEELKKELRTKLSQIDRTEKSMEARIASMRDRINTLERLTGATKRKGEATVSPVPSSGKVSKPVPTRRKVSLKRRKPAPVMVSDPDKLYRAAKAAFDKKNYSRARSLFAKFVGLYPNHPKADNSQFWLGETYFKEGKFEDAILEYQKVIQRYSTGNKVPDALLKQAISFEKLGDRTSARILFQKLVNEYSETEQAKIALRELKRME